MSSLFLSTFEEGIARKQKKLPTLSLSPRSDPPEIMRKGFLTPSKESGEAKSKSSPRAEASKETTSIADDVSTLLAENLDLDAPGGASCSSSSSRSSSSAAAPVPLKLTDVPNQVLVSILMLAAGDNDFWARFTIPYVCKAFRDLYRSRDASPLHEKLWLDFEKEIAASKKATSRRSPRREPVFRASRVISWARTHAESVRKLYLALGNGAPLGDFNATNFAQLVAAVGPHLTTIAIEAGFEKLVGTPFWVLLRGYVVRAGKLHKLYVKDITKGFSMSDVEPLVKLRGSLEELSLMGSIDDLGNPSIGLRRFPESFLGLTNLQKLSVCFHSRIKAIPAGISNLKNCKSSLSAAATFARCRKSWARSSS